MIKNNIGTRLIEYESPANYVIHLAANLPLAASMSIEDMTEEEDSWDDESNY